MLRLVICVLDNVLNVCGVMLICVVIIYRVSPVRILLQTFSQTILVRVWILFSQTTQQHNNTNENMSSSIFNNRCYIDWSLCSFFGGSIVLMSASPPHDILRGGGSIILSGQLLLETVRSPEVWCSFNGTNSIASIQSNDSISCMAPSSPSGTPFRGFVQIIVNQTIYTNSIPFSWYGKCCCLCSLSRFSFSSRF